MDNIEKIVEKKALEKIEAKNNSFENLQAEYLKKQVELGKDISNITNDFVKAKVTTDIVNDQNGEYKKLHKELADEQKETLKESFKQDKIKQQAETLSEKQKKAEAFYLSFRPILEFDFSNLVKKEEKQIKTYKDRSYGIPLMCLMLFLFFIPFCLFSIILALFNGINAVCEAIATFGKIAKIIATSIFVLIILALATYCCILAVDLIFGTNIISSIL